MRRDLGWPDDKPEWTEKAERLIGDIYSRALKLQGAAGLAATAPTTAMKENLASSGQELVAVVALYNRHAEEAAVPALSLSSGKIRQDVDAALDAVNAIVVAPSQSRTSTPRGDGSSRAGGEPPRRVTMLTDPAASPRRQAVGKRGGTVSAPAEKVEEVQKTRTDELNGQAWRDQDPARKRHLPEARATSRDDHGDASTSDSTTEDTSEEWEEVPCAPEDLNDDLEKRKHFYKGRALLGRKSTTEKNFPLFFQNARAAEEFRTAPLYTANLPSLYKQLTRNMTSGYPGAAITGDACLATQEFLQAVYMPMRHRHFRRFLDFLNGRGEMSSIAQCGILSRRLDAIRYGECIRDYNRVRRAVRQGAWPTGEERSTTGYKIYVELWALFWVAVPMVSRRALPLRHYILAGYFGTSAFDTSPELWASTDSLVTTLMWSRHLGPASHIETRREECGEYLRQPTTRAGICTQPRLEGAMSAAALVAAAPGAPRQLTIGTAAATTCPTMAGPMGTGVGLERTGMPQWRGEPRWNGAPVAATYTYRSETPETHFTAPTDRTPQPAQCYVCHGFGHIARHCGNRRGRERESGTGRGGGVGQKGGEGRGGGPGKKAAAGQ